MARFEPFVGLRYDEQLPLEKLVAPPYDVVGPAQRAELAARHPANAIHVELPEDDTAAGLDRYAHAAALLEAWRADGTLRPDHGPTFSVYRMVPPSGAPTTGVIGALGCEPPGGDVLPHEQTIPKDTTDRLDLLRACRANLSPIWGLSLAPGLARHYQPDGPPDVEAADDDGVRHQLWVVDDPAAMAAISEAVASAPVVIADGHHRYQTACTYQAERRAAGDGAGGHDLVMALVVELAEDQLQVGAIHRTLTGLPAGDGLLEAVRRWCDAVHAGPAEAAVVAAAGEAGALALVTPTDVWLLTPRPEAAEAAGSDLDSSLVALVVGSMPGASSAHHHSWQEAVTAVRDGEAEAAVLLRPVTVAQIAAWAHDRRQMPPKSTYFFPKPRTGMVYRPLGG